MLTWFANQLVSDHLQFGFKRKSGCRQATVYVKNCGGSCVQCSGVNKTKFLTPRPRPPEVNKGTWRI